ncbi:HAD-IA family hydrolase [Pseudoalteromonas luteoviolacea]|uniref:HAD-IA family hydrolase n=1 Tax=Pseudoalteromonas luteoviolacea TaxID=43657 RepID=UPI001B384228|nr:HAD-IA family hydrolase [Pseudoalteromonas luteoviolacea]MBQ4812773.1 HAD-IA family hydrolase [Pseudoalteromonas luteoviolacea]
MRFNKAISPIKVLSFDLDDTLYNNHPIILNAIQAMQSYLQSIPEWAVQQGDYWLKCRRHIGETQPHLKDDVTNWRKVALEYGMSQLGLENKEVARHSVNAYQAFADARSNITVAQSVLSLLLALKKKYTLIAITNGNVEVDKFNLAGVFERVYLAGPDGAAKPDAALFERACQDLKVSPSEILHIGDSLDTDVRGANLAGCHSVWLDNQQTTYAYKGLADIEIQDIHQLACLK